MTPGLLRHWLGACLLLLAGVAAAFTPEQLRFEQLNAEAGLAHSSVTAILQDRDGFMWFAGQGGLSRYDGYRFLNFKNDPADPNSIADNSVQAVHQDPLGRLWVGTRNGLQRYNPRSDNFTSVLVNALKERQNDYYDVRQIASDAQGVLWLTTRTGLIRFDPERNSASFLRHDPGKPDSLASDDVGSLVFDAHGGLWLGTGAGVDYLAPGARVFAHFPVDQANPGDVKRNTVKVMTLGPGNTLWVGNAFGLEEWQLEQGQPVRRRRFGTAEGMPAGPVTAVYQDRKGGMWVGTQSFGLLRWDAAAGTFTRFTHQPGNRASLADNYVSGLFQDRSGILWVGTWFSGASRVDLSGGGFRHIVAAAPGDPQGLSSNKISAILGDGPDALWLAAYGGGINRLDLKTGKTRVYRRQLGVAGTLNDDLTTCIGRDVRGQLWVGTRNGGLSRFDPASGRFAPRPFVTGDDLSDFIQAIVPDRAGMLWIASRGGLHRLDPRTDQAKTFRHDPLDPASLADNFVWNILEDQAGRLWVGTSNGLNLLDRASGRFRHFALNHSRISFLHEGSDGALWVGTGGGLNRIEADAGGKFSVRTWLANDGMINPAVNGILEDERRQLWISTDGGIVNFDPSSGRFRHYTGRDGMAEGDYFVGSAYKLANGDMAFGSFNNGLTLLRPSAVRGNMVAPQVKITDFQIYNESVRGGRARAGFSIDGPIHDARQIVLPHGDAMFSLEFAALHFADPRRNAYRYQLDGVDKNWVRTDAAKRFASYTNVAPGKYVFRVQASNKDGVWNEDGVTLGITVTPPFWATWWFRLAVAAAALSLLALAYRARVSALVRQKTALERQVAQRTTEVVQQKESLVLEKIEAERQKTRAELAQRNIALLSELGKRITSKLDRDAIMVTVQRHVLALMESDVFGFGVFDAAQQRIEFALVTADGLPQPGSTVSSGDAGQLAAWAVLQGHDVFINDLHAECDGYLGGAGLSPPAPAAGAPTPASLLYAPMVFNHKVVGVLAVHSRRPHAYQRMHMDMLATLASYTAVAMDNAATYEQLARAQQKLVLTEKMASLGTLSAGIAHEINNPTNYAHAGAQLMADDLERFRIYLLELAGADAAPELRASLESRIGALVQQLALITDGTSRIRDLVKDLGTFSRIDDGEKKPMHLAPGLRSTVKLVRTLYSKVAELRCELDVDPLVVCRPAQLNQVFMNLIVNACQAIESKQAHGAEPPGVLTITSRIDGANLCIDFEDTGSGIGADVIGRIYDPFFTTKPTGEGTGLGLSISFGIVEQHGGKLVVRSVAGEGSCFTVVLPLAPRQ